MTERSTREDIMSIARDLIAENGVEKTSMLEVAQRAGSSKETLYNWFGNKEGLIEAICLREAAEISSRLERALTSEDADFVSTLEQLGVGLLSTLLSDWSLAINRGAMQSPKLSVTLLSSGRFAVGPMVARYLETHASRHNLALSSGEAGFQQFFGLLMQDFQIRALLFDQAISPDEYPSHAREATNRFLKLLKS